MVDLENDSCVAYSVLNHFGRYCAQHYQHQEAMEIMNMINLFYQSKNIFISNAIENEFLSVLATELDMTDLMNSLKRMPEGLWTAYLRVLIAAQKV